MKTLKKRTLKHSLPSPSEDEVLSMEGYFGFGFPDSYLEFLSSNNGGIPQNWIFHSSGTERLIERFLCIAHSTAPSSSRLYDIAVVHSQISERLNDQPDEPGCALIPIAAVFGGDFLCLDYRCGSDPEVVLWKHEESEEFAPATEAVANSFSDFIALG